jgi:predicted transcriptional regulator
MKDLKVISGKCMPARSPISTALLWYIMLDFYNAPGWLWGVLGTFIGFWSIIFVIAQFREDPTDIFKEGK